VARSQHEPVWSDRVELVEAERHELAAVLASALAEERPRLRFLPVFDHFGDLANTLVRSTP
jgi:hypothetical protein